MQTIVHTGLGAMIKCITNEKEVVLATPGEQPRTRVCVGDNKEGDELVHAVAKKRSFTVFHICI